MKGSRMTTEIVILVVDDNQTNLQLLGEMLEMEGYGVRLASNGLEGLEVARSAHPSLILLDENMPGMDGVEVCRKLKLDPALNKIPVIFLSGLDSTSLKILAFREGAVDFITKPFHVEEVLARVHTHLQLVQQVELEAKSKELQQSHEAQKLLLEQYTALFDYAPVGYVSLDQAGRILNINLAGANMFGQVRSRIKKQLLVQFVADEDHQLFVDFLKKVFSRCARRTTCELRLIRGGVTPLFVHLEAIASGSGLECLVTITDVTTLRLEEQKFRIVADNTYDWEFWINPEGTFIYCSPSSLRMTGYDQASFMGDKGLVIKIVHPDDRETFARHRQETANIRVACEMDFRIIRADGEIRWVSHACRPVYDSHGIFLGTRGSNRDITQRKQAEKLLQDSEQSFRELNKSLEEKITRAIEEMRRKDQILVLHERRAVMGEMINNIAHQWRQPLNVLGLNLQELPYSYGKPDFNLEYLESCVESSMQLIEHMSQTIDDFRNFFRSDKKISEFSVNKVIERTLALVDKNFQQQKVNIEFRKEGEPLVEGYPNEYSQALLNILINARDALVASNAVDSQILIRSFTEGEKEVVTIADNAGGIADDIIDRLFDPYFTTKGPDKGTGIGLFMSMTIIEKNMGGRLTVHNTGSGAEFRIEV